MSRSGGDSASCPYIVPCGRCPVSGRAHEGGYLRKTGNGRNSGPTDPDRNHCCPPEVGCARGGKGRPRGSIAQRALGASQAAYRRGVSFYFGIKNPDGELKYRPFMLDAQRPLGLPVASRPFRCCALAPRRLPPPQGGHHHGPARPD